MTLALQRELRLDLLAQRVGQLLVVVSDRVIDKVIESGKQISRIKVLDRAADPQLECDAHAHMNDIAVSRCNVLWNAVALDQLAQELGRRRERMEAVHKGLDELGICKRESSTRTHTHTHTQ